MKMLIWSLMVLGLVVASNAYADIEKIYAQSCATCHDSGTFNAPKKVMLPYGIA